MVAEFCRVYARVRPPAKVSPEALFVEPPNGLKLYRGEKESVYEFDDVFPATIEQEQVFTSVAKRIVDGCVDGFNGTVFAYGQTGSGKTFTMMGPQGSLEDQKMRGLIPRVADEIFFILDSKREKESFNFGVSCIFLELYNEVLYDLLSPGLEKVTITDDGKNVNFSNATYETVETATDLIRLVGQGLTNRHVGKTKMNLESSRSHAICVIDIEMHEDDGGVARKRTSRLNLVDLAGSERQSHTGSSGDRLKEAGSINKSLLTLSKVIRSLASGKNEHVAYRESKLTHVLKDSLGGSSRTAVIVNVHPNVDYSAETQSTLLFSSNCRKIKNQAKSNTEISGDSVVLLRQQLATCTDQMKSMQMEFELKLEERLKNATIECQTWQSRAIESQRQNNLYQAELDLCKLALNENEVGRVLNNDTISNLEKAICARINEKCSSSDLDLEAMRLAMERSQSELKEVNAAKRKVEEDLMKALEKNSDVINQTLLNSPLRREDRDGNAFTPKEKKNRRRTMLAPATPLPNRNQRLLFDDSEMPEPKADGTSCTALQDEIDSLKLALLEKEKAFNEKDRQVRDLQNNIESIVVIHKSQLQCKHKEYQELAESDLRMRQELSEANRRISVMGSDFTKEETRNVELQDRCRKESKERMEAAKAMSRLNEKCLELQDELAQKNCEVDDVSRSNEQLQDKVFVLEEKLAGMQSLDEEYEVLAADHLKVNKELADRENTVRGLKAEISRLSSAREKDVEELTEKYRRELDSRKAQSKEHEARQAELERKKQEFFDACEERAQAAERISAKTRQDMEEQLARSAAEIVSKDYMIVDLQSQISLQSSEADERMQRKVQEYKREFKHNDPAHIVEIFSSALDSRSRSQTAKDEEYSAKIFQLQEELVSVNDENTILNKQLSVSHAEITKLSADLQESSGHGNKNQKIRVLETLRTENYELKQKVAKFEGESSKVCSDRVLRKKPKP